ncbi:MAG: hypothetical protein HYY85_00925 [Deltaproteobacteria bacterium]|nr:hypothetical protein [Deltaproteobacteria bacterium]
MRETYLTSLRKQLALHLQGRLPVQRSRDGGPAVRVDLTLLPGGRLAGIRVTTGTLLSGPVERALADGLTLPPPPQALSESFLDPFFLVSIEQGEVIVR